MLFSIAVAACGGGGGSSVPAPTPVTPAATYAISGTITGASGVVAVSLGGASTATTSAATNGTYSFTGLANGSYTVTPTATGNLFVPAQLAVNISGANVTGQDFTATQSTAATYSISGAVSGAVTSGVKIDFGTAGSTLTATGGTYTMPGLVAATYTVTPSLTGYTFNPTSASITIVAGNVMTGADFTATAIPVAHTLSGTVSGAPAGVSIDVTGTATAHTTTAAGGTYTLSLYDGTYTVTPTLSGYTFNPNSASVTMSGAAKTQNFVGTANTAVKATVNGTVTGAWVQGVNIAMSGGQTGTTTTNASGNYSFANLPSDQTYTFTPSLAGYTFAASSVSATIPPGSSATVAASAVVATSVVPSTSISGTVSYPIGTNTGGIRIQAYWTNCTGGCAVAGTTIAAPGAYTINGLQPGMYDVIAEMDAQGTGQENVNNPVSPASTGVDTTAGNATGINLTLADPAAPAAAAPTGLSVAPGNGVGLVQYTPATDINGQEIATGYQLTWGTLAGTPTGSGSKFFAAQGTNTTVYMLSGVTNGTYYFQLTACVGGTAPDCTAGATSTASSVVSGPVVVGATTGTYNVSGTVTFSGTTTTAPMYIAIHNNAGAYVQRIAAPLSSPVSYSISGVPAGDYNVAVIIDNNDNGEIDAGDISNANENQGGPGLTVTTATTFDMTLSNASSTAQVTTDHQFDSTVTPADTYSVSQSLNDGTKRIVKAILFSGANMALPLDMPLSYGSFSNYGSYVPQAPGFGDTYQFLVTYSDGTSEVVSGSVNGVLGASALATNLNVTNPTTPTPTFTWTPAATPPTGCSEFLDIGSGWYYPQSSTGLPCSTNSVLYNADGMAPPLGTNTGNIYPWWVMTQDVNGNTASATGYFTN